MMPQKRHMGQGRANIPPSHKVLSKTTILLHLHRTVKVKVNCAGKGYLLNADFV